MKINLIIILLVTIFLQVGSTQNLFDCDNRLIASFESPDKSMKAIVFERNCGATTGFNRQITLMKISDEFPKHEKLNSFFVAKDEPKIEVVWQSTNSLTVKYESGFQVLRKDTPNSSIIVKFEGSVFKSKLN